MDCSPPRLLCPWNFPGKNTVVGSISYSRVSSWLRDWTHVSWSPALADRFFTTVPPGKPLLLLLLLSHFSRVWLCATHRGQPTRLPRPWHSPGKNTGVGCHFLLQCMKVKSESEVAQSCPTLRNPMDCSLPGSSIHGIFHARVLKWGAIAFSEVSFQEKGRIKGYISSLSQLL